MKAPQKTGILLVNTGSPDSPEVPAVRTYLRQFLSDPRVIDLHPVARWLLVNCIILPTRPKTSAAAYKSIWTDRGSPLVVNSQEFCDALGKQLPGALIEIGMAYGKPSVPAAMDALVAQGATRLMIVPMFPQYASATVGSVLELAYKTAAHRQNVPALSILPPFYEEPEFLDAWAAVARPELDGFRADHIVISFHGLPERHVRKADPTGSHCLAKADCCKHYLDGNPMCYRAHCFATAEGITQRLGLSPDRFTIAFQSRLGRDPWLKPATDETVVALAKNGVKRLAIVSPAFVADCIETLEELGGQAKESFLHHGGADFLFVPSLNAHPQWVSAFAEILRRNGA
jgi:ferrochelatase